MLDLAWYLVKDNVCYTLRWSDHLNYITIERDGYETLSLKKDTAFDLIDAWYRPHFKD